MTEKAPVQSPRSRSPRCRSRSRRSGSCSRAGRTGEPEVRGQRCALGQPSAGRERSKLHVPDMWSCSTGRRCSERRWPGSTSCNTPCSTPGIKQAERSVCLSKHAEANTREKYIELYIYTGISIYTKTHPPHSTIALLSCLHEAVATVGEIEQLPSERGAEESVTPAKRTKNISAHRNTHTHACIKMQEGRRGQG